MIPFYISLCWALETFLLHNWTFAMTRQLMDGAFSKGMLSFEHASDVMTQTRLRQTNWNGG